MMKTVCVQMLFNWMATPFRARHDGVRGCFPMIIKNSNLSNPNTRRHGEHRRCVAIQKKQSLDPRLREDDSRGIG